MVFWLSIDDETKWNDLNKNGKKIEERKMKVTRISERGKELFLIARFIFKKKNISLSTIPRL